jgi:hypothetical protein
MLAKGVFIALLFLSAALGAPASAECQEGTAQPSVRVLVIKLERAFKKQDAMAIANLAGCPFTVGQPESDDLSYVPSSVFAERFLRAVRALDLTLKIKATCPQRIRRSQGASFCG